MSEEPSNERPDDWEDFEKPPPEVFTPGTAIFAPHDMIDFKESIVRVGDNANKYLQQRVVSVLYELPLIQTIRGATKVADRLLRALSYPLAEISVVVNRKANRLQMGDLFEFSYSLYGITKMVCRVGSIDEGDLLSETITINAKESIDHISNTLVISDATVAGYISGSGEGDLDELILITSEAGIENNIIIVLVDGGIGGAETAIFSDETNTLTITIEDGVSTQQNVADAIVSDSHISLAVADVPSTVWTLGIGTDTVTLKGAYTGVDYGILGDVGANTANVSEVLDVIAHAKVIEAPYVFSGDTVVLGIVASRAPNKATTGYQVYVSYDDGDSYQLLHSTITFSPYGSLVSEYSDDTFQLDDVNGFEIDSDDFDIWSIETITRAALFTKRHIALLGNELISFQSIEPHPTIDGRFVLSGIYRGLADTVQQTHAAGTDFFFLGESRFAYIAKSTILTGVSIKVKCVPFSANNVGDISNATEMGILIEGRARKPYYPINFKANDVLYSPKYTTSIDLSWDSRIRGKGAGIGIATVITDAEPTWEGFFEIEVWVLGSKVRSTVDDVPIDALSWEYTSGMNIVDNGSLADEIIFKLINYRIIDNYKYKSSQVEILVTKE